ncbi:MAG: recombinase-like helix-turn-helix domain-containing protein [Alphaproteobacteria bacterium]
MDYNPWLAEQRSNKGDPSTIERSEAPELYRWQTRARRPTAYEDRLADALTAIFAEEVYEIDGIVGALNSAGVPDPDGAPWTVESFPPAMKRLGDGS